MALQIVEHNDHIDVFLLDVGGDIEHSITIDSGDLGWATVGLDRSNIRKRNKSPAGRRNQHFIQRGDRISLLDREANQNANIITAALNTLRLQPFEGLANLIDNRAACEAN